jgi:large subunit ribosomal protein L9
MFERDEAGFTEDYDPNAEPGTIEAPAASDESNGGDGEAASEA